MKLLLLCFCMIIMLAQAAQVSLNVDTERGFAMPEINIHDTQSIVHNTGKPAQKRDDPKRDQQWLNGNVYTVIRKKNHQRHAYY